MKKPLLKASLICLGVILLCGLSSFKTPEGAKSQQCDASIVYDTIITQVGQESRCEIKEVVESDQGDCECFVSLKVITTGKMYWELWLKNECQEPVLATYKYIIHAYHYPGTNHYTHDDHGPHTFTRRLEGGEEIIPYNLESLNSSVCEPISVEANFIR